MDAADILNGVEGISFVHFNDRDVVRHPLVQRIVKAYERANDASARQLGLNLSEPLPDPVPGMAVHAAALQKTN
jgi:phosphate starvation-inducible PhoH-like protein